MTIELQSIALAPGAALWLQEDGGPEGSAWHLESAGDHWWLSSPALLTHPVASEHLHQVLVGLFVLQAEAAVAPDFRVCMSEAGDLVIQWRVLSPNGPTVGCAALETTWPAARDLWKQWLDVMEGRSSVQDAVASRTSEAPVTVDAGPIQRLLRLLQGDEQLRRLRVEPVEDGALVLESPVESWLVGAVVDPTGRGVRFSTLIDALPPDPMDACRATLRALKFNSGAILGPHLTLVAQLPDSGPGAVLLHSRLSLDGADSEDVKAALGELLALSEELEQRLSDAASDPERPLDIRPEWWGLHLRG